MQASRRITPNTKCVTPARWGNRGAEHGLEIEPGQFLP